MEIQEISNDNDIKKDEHLNIQGKESLNDEKEDKNQNGNLIETQENKEIKNEDNQNNENIENKKEKKEV